ncbi:MAG: DUF2162 family putative transporter, partial [Desulfotignum sp.]
MAVKTLILGLVFSLGVFAVKAGAGLAYLWETKPGVRWKIMAGAGVAAGYGLAFLAAGYIILRVDLTAHLDRVMAWMKHGMTLHLVMAALLLAFSLKFSSALTPELARSLARLDVPVLSGISLYRETLSGWRDSPKGIDPVQVAWAMATPEISGLVEPTVLTA